MAAITFAAICAGIGLGTLLIAQGVRGRRVLPEIPGSGESTSTSIRLPWLFGAVVAALAILAITGWPVAAVATGAAVMYIQRLLGGNSDQATSVARTQAIATWTEMIRDNMAGAAGLEQALMATATVAPLAIAAEVNRFARRLEERSLSDALAILGDELDHPSADMVVAALANAARMEGRDLGALLSRLAESIRGDVRMRLRVEVGRARIRTSARIVVAVTVFTIVFMYLFSRPLLDVYDTAAGQLWLLVVLAIFGLGGWMLNHYSRIEMPERFSARTTSPRQTVRRVQ